MFRCDFIIGHRNAEQDLRFLLTIDAWKTGKWINLECESERLTI